jgi:hypothetical protein
VVIGGGNVNKMDKLPPGCRPGDNTHAFRGGFLLWEEAGRRKPHKTVQKIIRTATKGRRF